MAKKSKNTAKFDVFESVVVRPVLCCSVSLNSLEYCKNEFYEKYLVKLYKKRKNQKQCSCNLLFLCNC